MAPGPEQAIVSFFLSLFVLPPPALPHLPLMPVAQPALRALALAVLWAIGGQAQAQTTGLSLRSSPMLEEKISERQRSEGAIFVGGQQITARPDLAEGDWLRHARNLLITGATGCGKTWLACALAHQGARSGFSVLYVRAARLFDELQVAHGDGSFARRLAQLAKLDLLVIDDFAISPMGAAERNDLLELLDDRIGTRSTLITSQLPVKQWHTYLGDPTLADAILDRIVHSSHKIELKGKSLRDPKDEASGGASGGLAGA